jgi:hypothetical protein
MEENKYQRGKIYKIISPHTDKIYIGSTTEIYLSKRLTKHKSNYKDWCLDNNKTYTTSFELFKLGNVEIILIETYSCNSKDELHKKEREHIELNKENIINKNKPSRTKEDLKIQRKKYKDGHKDQIKQYTEDHKDHIKEYKKNYYEKNKDQINEKANKKFNCGCGSIIRIAEKSRHEKSEKHHIYELEQNL